MQDVDSLNTSFELGFPTLLPTKCNHTHSLKIIQIAGARVPCSRLAVIATGTAASSAQLPEPLLYYPLDEPADSLTVTDLSGNGYTGDVNGSVIFGLAGAPGGASPAGAGQFSTDGRGMINVSGLDVPSLLGKRDGLPEQDDLSYTMACWILPSAESLSGDRFFFGQSVQGIHNGLRQNGRPHQAHWSADHYGVTQLNTTEWAHVTFTYDGLTNTGTIYLNGVQDGSPTSKIGPNGSGNFVVGARQGNLNGTTGEANFVGLIDDVVVYQEVLTQAQIDQLVSGVSPIDFDDTDSDGMTDSWEITNLGAGAHLDNGSTNPDFGPSGDPDSDNSSNLEEFTRLTDPLDDDSDDDGALDGSETATNTWTDATNRGTDPKNPDSDGDGLLDGVENPDLPFLDENQTGSDPNLADTDSDEFTDDVKVSAGTDPNNSSAFPPPTLLPITDDFETDPLNKVIWLSNTNIPQGGAVVVQEDGHVRIDGRGHLYTRDQYDPAALGGIYIKGRWTFSGGDDFLQILTRSDAIPAGQYGETQNGIEFNVNQINDGFDVRTRGNQFNLAGNLRSGDITLKEDSTYEFIVMDDGAGALGMCLWEVGNRANAAGVSNSINTASATHHHIVIHNREGSRSSNLEEIEIGVLTDSANHFPVTITNKEGRLPASFFTDQLFGVPVIPLTDHPEIFGWRNLVKGDFMNLGHLEPRSYLP
ncbi:MAG: LamG-like jellyroll fold domain-containing protein [Akkermansiaceae bacterium]